MTPQELYTKLVELVEKGDDAGIDEFINEHMDSFPEEMRDQIAMTLLATSIHEEAAGALVVGGMQEELLTTIKQITSAEAELDNQDRIDELKTTLGIPDEGK